jgi:citrate synthase
VILDGKEYEFPVIVGSENEKAIDIGSLRAKTGYITMDPGYVNTGAASSSITFLDGEKGILRYRGIPIEQLAEKSTFVETSYLLIYGELPTKPQLEKFSKLLTNHSMIHEDMKHFFDGFPAAAHPMAILSSMVCSLSAYYPESQNIFDADNFAMQVPRLLSKLRTIAAFSYKKSIGHPMMYPLNHLSYCANFLQMMFAVPAQPYEVDADMVRALNILLILHADHEQNCSTSTVRMVGSSQANLFASVSAGILALWGPLHGGANQAVIEMLEEIQKTGMKCQEFIQRVKDKNSKTRLMGFGHRVYKSYDPRAKILKEMTDLVLSKKGINDPMLDLAKEMEETALSDPYFVERNLYPNVDFYSGILYKAMGIPVNMFTVMFAIGRLPGWIAHWKEMIEDPQNKIGRPRQIYTGATTRDYVPIEARQ